MYRARLAGAVAAAVLAAGAASAQDASNFYLKGFGGWTIPQNNDFTLDTKPATTGTSTGFDYDTGYILGAAAGYQISPNVGLELEYAYRSADADLKRVDGKGTTQSNAFMANAIYTFDGLGPNGAFRPYLGAGIGAANLNYDGSSGTPNFDGSYNFAYQAITGVAYQLTPKWSLNGEVRYFGIVDQTLDNNDFKFKSDYGTVDALFGATYHF